MKTIQDLLNMNEEQLQELFETINLDELTSLMDYINEETNIYE